MLESLSGFSKKEAQGILSSVTLSLLPNPSLEPRHPIDEALYRRILAESREKLSVDPSDETAETRSRVVDFLGNQISESILRGADVDRIKSRLGESGYLRPDEYEVTTIPASEDFIDGFRLNKADIFDTVSYPYEIEHFPSMKLQNSSTSGLTLCVKSFGAGRDRYVLIVISFRKGRVMEINFAFRVFFADVNIQSTHSPIEVLKAFINCYGVRFRLGNLPVANFYQQEALPLKSDLPDTQSVLANYVRPLADASSDHSDFYTCMMAHSINSLRLMFFSFVFLINLDKYRKDLETHS